MRFGKLKRYLSLFDFLIGVIFFITIGCHAKTIEKSKTEEPELAENKPAVASTQTITAIDDFKSIFSSDISPQQAIKQTKNIVTNFMLLDISDKNKKELSKIKKYLDNIKSPSDYLNDDNNIIDFLQTSVRLNVILAKIEPDNFDINHQVAYNYVNAGRLINSLAQSEEHRLISAEYKKKGFKAAEELVEKFPDEAEAYFQLAFFNIAKGDKKKALELYKRCLELDPELESCQKNYDDLREELNRANP